MALDRTLDPLRTGSPHGLPGQDLRFDLSRIPTLPRSGVVPGRV